MLEDTHEVHIEKDKENDTYKIDHPNVLSRSQKLIASLLAFFAFLTVVVWSMQLKNSIDDPFDYKNKNNKTIAEIIQEEELASCDGPDCKKEDSRMKDTDGDGLWDWDEINIYHTSIYLEDTDSDGIFDKKEVDDGSDPNCSEGQNCHELPLKAPALSEDYFKQSGEPSQAEMLEFLSQFEDQEPGVINGSGNVTGIDSSEEAMQQLLGGNSSISDLRTMLKNAGMDPVVLDSLSDEQLMDVYTKMLN